jgi:hypothetical protein
MDVVSGMQGRLSVEDILERARREIDGRQRDVGAHSHRRASCVVLLCDT